MTASIMNGVHLSLIICLLIMQGVIISSNRRDREKKRFSPSKWVTNRALDVWYGNKTMVDLFFGGLSEMIERIASRPGRSPFRTVPHHLKLFVNKAGNESDAVTSKPLFQPVPALIQEGMQIISRVDINFINEQNETVHTIQLRPQPDKKNEYLKALTKKKVF